MKSSQAKSKQLKIVALLALSVALLVSTATQAGAGRAAACLRRGICRSAEQRPQSPCNGSVCIASAGNDGSWTPVYPAATSGAVAVGTIDEIDNHAWFSNSGAWLSHSSPGASVLTTDIGGGYALSTGTSPSAAFNAGVFSLLIACEPALSPASALARVEQGAFDLGSSGWDPAFGWGGIDALASLVPGEPGATPPDKTDSTVELLSPTKGSPSPV